MPQLAERHRPIAAPPAFDGLLPAGCQAVELRGDAIAAAPAHPQEAHWVAAAVAKRRHEFFAGRDCARHALARLGLPPVAIGVGALREPLFPPGVSGSITHTDGLCAAAVVRVGAVLAIGIDAERNAALEDSIVDLVLTPDERRAISETRHPFCADTLVFSCKEAVFKAAFPLCRRYLEFAELAVRLDPDAATFDVALKDAALASSLSAVAIRGRYRFDGAHLYTAVHLLPVGTD